MAAGRLAECRADGSPYIAALVLEPLSADESDLDDEEWHRECGPAPDVKVAAAELEPGRVLRRLDDGSFRYEATFASIPQWAVGGEDHSEVEEEYYSEEEEDYWEGEEVDYPPNREECP